MDRGGPAALVSREVGGRGSGKCSSGLKGGWGEGVW